MHYFVKYDDTIISDERKHHSHKNNIKFHIPHFEMWLPVITMVICRISIKSQHFSFCPNILNSTGKISRQYHYISFKVIYDNPHFVSNKTSSMSFWIRLSIGRGCVSWDTAEFGGAAPAKSSNVLMPFPDT